MVQTRLEEKLAGLSEERRNYLLCALPAHLAESGRLNDSADILCHLGFIRAKCRLGMISELLTDYSYSLKVFGARLSADAFEMLPSLETPDWVKKCTLAVLDGMPDPHPDLGSGALLNKLRSLTDNDRRRDFQKPLVIVGQSLPTEIIPEDNTANTIRALRKKNDGDGTLNLEEGDSEPLRRLKTFAVFVQKHAHLFGRNPTDIVQAARNWAYKGVVEEAAQQFIGAGELPWITRDPRPRQPSGESPCLKVLKSDFGTLNKIALSRDGAWVVSGAATLLSVWNLRDGISYRKLHGHSSRISSVVLSDDASVCVSLDTSGMMLIWNPLTRSDGDVLTVSAKIDRCLAMTADGACLLSGGEDGIIRVWCVKTKRCVRNLEGHTGAISDLSILPDGRLAISGSTDGTARIWDVAAGTCLRILYGGSYAKAVTAVVIAREGTIAYTGHQDHSVRMWDLRTGTYLRRFGNVHKNTISAIAVSDDGSLVASADTYRRICIWDGATSSLIHVFDDHTRPVKGLAMVQNGRFAVSVGDDKAIRVWNLTFPGKEMRPFGHTEAVFGVSLLSDHRPSDIPSAISCGNDRTVRLWDTRTGYCLKTLTGHQGAVYFVAFLPVRGFAVSASKDGTMQVWNLKHGVAQRILADTSTGLEHFVLHAQNGLAITVRSSGDPTIWDTNLGRQIGTLPVKQSRLIGISWLPDAKAALTIDESAAVKIWSVPNGEIVCEWKADFARVHKSALSSDGDLLALANDENCLRIYESRSGRCLFDYGASPAKIFGLKFSNDNKTLVSFDAHHRICVWHPPAAQCSDIITLPRQNGKITRIQLHPAGRFVICAQSSSLTLIDVVNQKVLSEYLCESDITALSEVSVQGNAICGTRLGQLHFIKLRGWESTSNSSNQPAGL
jgi:WD40 repeat protein